MINRQPEIIDAELYSFDDPLAFLPSEPRYSLTPLFPELEAVIEHEQITATSYQSNFLALGLNSGEVAVFFKDVLISKTNPDVDQEFPITQIKIIEFDVPVLELIAANSFGTVYQVYIDVSMQDYQENFYQIPVICSAVPDTVLKLDYSEYNQLIGVGYNSGKVFIAQVPPKTQITKLYEPQSATNSEILDLKFLKHFLLIATKQEFLVFDSLKRQIFTKLPIPDTSQASITVDADVCILTSNDTVFIFLFHFPRPDFGGTPFSIAIETCLLQSGNEEKNANCFGAENLMTFTTYGSSEFDFLEQRPDELKMEQIKKYEQEESQNITIEEVSRFELQDPPALILRTQTCGESILLLTMSHGKVDESETQENEVEREQQVAPNSWCSYNAERYSFGEADKDEFCTEIQCFDIFGNEIFGNLVPLVQLPPGVKKEEFYPQIGFEYDCERCLRGLPSYLLSTEENLYELQPCTAQDHIRYLLQQNEYEKALLAGLLLENWDCELLKGLNYYFYSIAGKIRPLTCQEECYLESFVNNFKLGVYEHKKNTSDANSRKKAGDSAAQNENFENGTPGTEQGGLGQQNQIFSEFDGQDDDQLQYDPFADIFSSQPQEKSQPEAAEEDEPVINAHLELYEMPSHFTFQSIFLREIDTLLLQNASRIACFCLQNLLPANDPLWTTIALRFGISKSFPAIIQMLPLPEIEARLGLLALTLAHSYDSLTNLLLKWKMEAFPREILPILELKTDSPDLSASKSCIYMMLQQYEQFIRSIETASVYPVKVYKIFSEFSAIILQIGVFDQNISSLRPFEIQIDRALQKQLINAADVLFSIDTQNSAKIFTKIAAAGDHSAEIFTVLSLGAAKQLLGVPMSEKLSKKDFGNDYRNLRVYLFQALCVYQSNGRDLPPCAKIIAPLYAFLAHLLRFKDAQVLNCFPESGYSLQDVLLAYAPFFEPEMLSFYIRTCESANYLQTLHICEEYTDIDTFLGFVVSFEKRQFQVLPEEQIQFLQQAVQITLSQNQVQKAIDFIRKLQEAYSANPQQGRLLRQARLWQFLTKHLQKGRGVVELLNLIAKESVPVDVQEVIEMLGDSEEKLGDVLFQLVDSLRILNNLEQECAVLVKNDCVSMRGRLFTEGQKSVFIRANECKFCGETIIEKDISKNIDYVAFQCGHLWHIGCLEKSGCSEKGDLICPECAKNVI